jgi:hypothetical protein
MLVRWWRCCLAFRVLAWRLLSALGVVTARETRP